MSLAQKRANRSSVVRPIPTPHRRTSSLLSLRSRLSHSLSSLAPRTRTSSLYNVVSVERDREPKAMLPFSGKKARKSDLFDMAKKKHHRFAHPHPSFTLISPFHRALQVERQIDQMVRFIRQEAEEKAAEIAVTAEEVRD